MKTIRKKSPIGYQNTIGKALLVLAVIVALVSHMFGQTITINAGTSYQTVRAWPGVGETGCADFPVSCTTYHDNVLQAAVDSGINGVTLHVYSGDTENTTDWWQLWIDANSDFPHQARTDWANNRFVPVNDNADPNVINASGFKWGHLNWSVDKYATPLKTKLAVRGESLWINVCFNHQSTANQLHTDTPSEYGEFVLAVWQHLNTTYGWVPNAFEIHQEPDGSPAVTASELAAMIVAARDRLVNGGFAKPYIIAPSTVSGPNANTFYNDIKTANATAASYIDGLSYHRYVDMDASQRAILLATKNADSKDSGMNEWLNSTNNYLRLWEDLEEVRNSFWIQFAIGYNTTNDSSVYFFRSGSTAIKTERWKYYEHVFKYVRANAVMKGVTNSDSNFKGLPFALANGKYVVPIKAASSGTATISGLPAGTYSRRRTQGDGTAAPSSYDTDLGNVTISAGQDVTMTFTAAGIGTVYDVDYLQFAATRGTIRGTITVRGSLKW